MRTFPLLATAALFAAALAWASPVAGDDERKSGGLPEADLELEILRRFPAVIQPGQTLETGLVLRNTASRGAHLVVRPGDGSDEGWREPSVWFEVWRKGADGVWKEAARRKVHRCKSHKPDWRGDVVEIPAGGELDVRSWARDPSRYELQEPGAYRLRAHYAWRRKAPPGSDGDLGRMKDVGAFEIVSDALAFGIERPLDVKVAVLTDVPAKGAPIGGVIDVHGVNTTKRNLHWSPMDWTPKVRVEGGRLRKNNVVMPVDHDNPRDLPPGGTSVAFAGWSARHDLVPDADAKVVRLTVTLRHRKPGGPVLRGKTVTIRVAR